MIAFNKPGVCSTHINCIVMQGVLSLQGIPKNGYPILFLG